MPLVLWGVTSCQYFPLDGPDADDDPLSELSIVDSVISSPEEDWGVLSTQVTYEPPPGGFGLVQSIAAGENGSAFIYDAKSPSFRRALFLYDTHGRLIRKIGEAGLGPGEYSSQHPAVVALEHGRILVSDVTLRRILIFDTSGTVVADLSGSDYRGASVGRAAGGGYWRNSRRIVPPDSVVERWIQYDESGVAVDTVVVPSWGVEPLTKTEFAPMISSLVDPSGNLLVNWTGRLRVVRETPNGRFALVANVSPVPFEPDERAELQRLVDFAIPRAVIMGRMPTRVPQYKPVVKQLRGVDWSGGLWVALRSPSERDDSPIARDPAEMPPGMTGMSWIEPERIGRFDSSGRFLGSVTLPIGTSFKRGDGSRLWGTRISEDGDIEVIQWVVRPN